MIPEVLQEYDDDYQFFYDAAMRKIGRSAIGDVPAEVVVRILNGEHPVRVFREYRRFTPDRLARRIGVQVGYIDDIESGKRQPTRRVLSDIAHVLRVKLEEIA